MITWNSRLERWISDCDMCGKNIGYWSNQKDRPHDYSYRHLGGAAPIMSDYTGLQADICKEHSDREINLFVKFNFGKPQHLWKTLQQIARAKRDRKRRARK